MHPPTSVAAHEALGNALVYTAAAYYVIGAVLIAVSVRVWWTHPVNRVFLFGPYLTEKGARLVLELWPFVFLFGAFIFSCAAEHHAHWAFSRGYVTAGFVEALGIIEAIISIWTAGSVAFWAVRTWLKN